MSNSIFFDTLSGKKTQRPPVWFMRQAGRVLPSYMKLREEHGFHDMMRTPELACKVTLLPYEDLGVDALILFSDILVVAEAMGMKLKFDPAPVFETALKNLKEPVKFLSPDFTQLTHVYDAIDLIIKNKPENIPLIGFSGSPFTTLVYMIQGFGRDHMFSDAIKFMYNNPKQMEMLMEAVTDLTIFYAENQCDHGISAFQIFETHAGLIPQDLYMELVAPQVKRVLKAVREKGVPTIYFPKGLGSCISKFGKEETDFLGIDWQTSIFNVRKYIDPKVGIQGNLDPRALASDKESLDRIMEKYFEFGQKEQNWIFNLGHGLTPDLSFENVKYVIDKVKSYDWKR
ncbi:MAG: uroporphyrinogen decarboxylase [Candidatus Delongbacteria bacterium]|nr:uroporphyrinogen decarboxylase [Candidatus Delongbacteria bacterium]MBN2834963.1 uroporphyrinogen decarboxylase [Candidatus Delongbacteria bacterium]